MPFLEISDLVVDHDPRSLARLPVRRADVVARLRAAGDHRGARIAAGLACDEDGILDPQAVDRRLVAVHTELQRLSEELRLGERVAEVLRPLLAAIRTDPAVGPLRVVDVGCGLGYLVRWLAASGALGPDVELVGVDFNAALVTEAERLARAEDLHCRFVRGNAFALSEPATVYVSTGVLHHFRGASLDSFFAAQAMPESPASRRSGTGTEARNAKGSIGSGPAAFCHFDIAATPLAPVGAWIFHRARMRDPLGRHDGVMSARRAHDDATLLRAAAQARGMVALVYEPRSRSNPFCTTVRPVLGLRPGLVPALHAALGHSATGRLTGDLVDLLTRPTSRDAR
ncbi:class I SAM-dependent methyltransferase [Streptomyces sp. NBC_00237]|uniref:class I SAM-dependent methyltransferase n=1 Tax=Streptomyces sp. NBC_00237 TaxID=2975687 RepID=UPI0022577EDE|nr:class I SAM-dependent methyltransferase [Streptomyces sp. NBC_00237]MCX5206507.1 class I SAM-dependent methyltransferase [Streptomyces sp. NBC_00237]